MQTLAYLTSSSYSGSTLVTFLLNRHPAIATSLQNLASLLLESPSLGVIVLLSLVAAGLCLRRVAVDPDEPLRQEFAQEKKPSGKGRTGDARSAFDALFSIEATNDFQIDSNSGTGFAGRLNLAGVGGTRFEFRFPHYHRHFLTDRSHA